MSWSAINLVGRGSRTANGFSQRRVLVQRHWVQRRMAAEPLGLECTGNQQSLQVRPHFGEVVIQESTARRICRPWLRWIGKIASVG